MFNMILPDNIFRHPENKEIVYDALDEFFGTDVFCEGEFEELRNKVLEVLKDEPEILKLIKDDLEDRQAKGSDD